MSAEAPVAPPPPPDALPDTGEARDTAPKKDTTVAKKAQVTQVAQQMLGAEAQQGRARMAGAESPEAMSPTDITLDQYESLRTGETADGKPYEGNIFKGTALALGPQELAFTLPDGGDQKLSFGNGEVSIAVIDSIIDDGDAKGSYSCFAKDTKSGKLLFLDAKGQRVDVAVEPQEDEDDWTALDRTRTEQAAKGNTILELAIDKGEAADTLLVAEAATVRDALSPERQALFDTYINTRPQNDPDGSYELPDDIDTTLQQVEASLPEEKTESKDHEKGILDEVIDRQLKQVAQEIQEIRARQAKQNEAGEPLSTADNVRLLKLNLEQNNLTLAQNAPGEFGIILQHGILQQISEQSTGSTIAIDAALSEAKTQAELAGLNFGKFLEDKGLEAQQIDQVMEAFKDPSRLPELFADDALMDKVGPAMMEGFFGKDANKLDVLTMFDNLTDANNDLLASFPPGLLDRIKGYAKDKPLRKAGILALILAAIPAAAAALAVGAGISLAGSVGRRG